MSLVDRVALVFGGMLLVALAAFLGLGIVGLRAPLQWLLQLTSVGFDAVIVSLLVGLLGIYLVFLGWYETERIQEKSVVKETELGDVHITLESLRSLISQTAAGVRGVRRVAVRLVSSAPLRVELDLHVLPDVVIPDVTESVQHTVGDCLRQLAGVDLADIRVIVRDVAAATKPRRGE